MRVNGRSQARRRLTGAQRDLENNIRGNVRGRMRKQEVSRKTSLTLLPRSLTAQYFQVLEEARETLCRSIGHNPPFVHGNGPEQKQKSCKQK